MAIHQFMNRGFSIVGSALILGAMVFPSISERAGAARQQDERLGQIRTLWAKVQDRIALAVKEAESGSPAGFYASEIVVNRHNGSWRASGTYYKKTVFWYSDQPEFAGGEPGGELSVLVKIEIQEIVAAKTFYRDFLFDKGKLVFALIQSPGDSGAAEEFRYYFAEGNLIRYMEGQKVVPAKPGTKAIEDEAKELQALFLATF